MSNQGSMLVPARNTALVVDIVVLDVKFIFNQSYHLKPGTIGGGIMNLFLFDVVLVIVVAEGHLRGQGSPITRFSTTGIIKMFHLGAESVLFHHVDITHAESTGNIRCKTPSTFT